MVGEWTEVVRQQLGMGRLLPLGGPADGAWISEHAASGVLRRAAEGMAGVRLGRLRISLAHPEAPGKAAVPPPPSALPPGPLRIEADIEVEFGALAQVPLVQKAEQVREVLLNAAENSIGLDTAEADLRITGLLEQSPPPAAEEGEAGEGEAAEGEPETAAGPGGDGVPEPSARIPAAAAAVPGVVRLAPVLGGLAARPVRIEDTDEPERRHVQVQVAAATTHRALDVAVAVRAAVTDAAAADTSVPVTVAVVVTAIEPP
jgi:hypothetical protein